MSLHTIQIPYSTYADEYFGRVSQSVNISSVRIFTHPCYPFLFNMQNPGVLVALPYRGWAPYLIVPEGYYALVTSSGAEIQTVSGSPVWPPGFISAGLAFRSSLISVCVERSFYGSV